MSNWDFAFMLYWVLGAYLAGSFHEFSIMKEDNKESNNIPTRVLFAFVISLIMIPVVIVTGFVALVKKD